MFPGGVGHKKCPLSTKLLVYTHLSLSPVFSKFDVEQPHEASSIIFENIFRSGLTLFSSNDIITIKSVSKLVKKSQEKWLSNKRGKQTHIMIKR